MSVSKVVAVAGGFMALLASAGASSAAAEPCVLDTEYPVTSVAASLRPTETGGYGGTAIPLLRGADIRVAAQPGLTAEWLERRLEAQVAAGECQFGADQVFVEVMPGSEELVSGDQHQRGARRHAPQGHEAGSTGGNRNPAPGAGIATQVEDTRESEQPRARCGRARAPRAFCVYAAR